MTDEKKPELSLVISLAEKREEARDITPNEQVIVMLERALEAARAGVICSIALAQVEKDGSVTTAYPADIHQSEYLHPLAAAIARLQHRYQREAYDSAFCARTVE